MERRNRIADAEASPQGEPEWSKPVLTIGRDGWNRTSDAGVKVPCLNRLATPLNQSYRAEAALRPCSLLGWAKGLEPSTLGTTIRCSTN